MTEHEARDCACPSLTELTLRGLEGKALDACPVHRPFPTGARTSEPVALNDGDALGQMILGAINKHTTD